MLQSGISVAVEIQPISGTYYILRDVSVQRVVIAGKIAGSERREQDNS